MSAESPRKSSRQGGHVVAPQPVSDRSIIESVAGFINEVVPQAYTSTPHGESKEAITWARFEYGDINDPALYPDTTDDRNGSPPLLLVLGYGSGVQVWAVPASGEATEVLSWRQGVVRTLRILPTPGTDSNVPDAFAHKRPLVAMCDSAGGPSPQFCSLTFISLRGGDQVKNKKFKNPVSDVLANRRSVVVTFPERIAVFDASTLEDRLTVITCYPCPGPNPNPVALGSRWLAYSERKLMPAHRSSGGTEGEGVQSYTATMLHAAKSFGKGLRELGETVASSLTGGTGVGMQRGMGGGVCGPMGGQPGGNMLGNSDAVQPGVITILDAQGTSSSGHVEDTRVGDSMMNGNSDNIIAHFLAHSDPVVALAFDPSGMLLLTADKRGHDFHVFRIHPHPGGSSLAAVHHLYVLHRGDTTAKVQDIAFAADSRWVAVSTLRGTTHVFPITPYGGPVGIRTHATPHVVNRLSRFHRSAGLTADGRNSPVPIPVSETVSTPPSIPYPNPRLPPYSHPTVISPLAQIRQPMTHTLLSASTPTSLNPASQQTYHRNPSMRTLGRTQSSSDDGLPGGGIPLRVTACFAPPRAWLIGSPTVPRDTPAKAHKRAVDSLFVMACHGNLIEYDLEPRHAAGIPKEKICDDTAIELDVQPKAQWMLLRPPHASELQPPLSPTNPLMVLPDRLPTSVGCESRQNDSDSDERWLSQVEIVTHAGPHRRLWMGPQFTFKTYNSTVTGIPLSLLEMEAVEVGVGSGSRPARSNPVNMPVGSGSRPVVPVLIESGSGSSYEQSPRLLEAYGTDGADSDGSAGPGETQLREDLADAMMESPGVPTRDTGRRVIVEMCHGTPLTKKISNPIQKVVNPVGTVITVSCPSEEGSTLQTFSINAATEHKSSSDDEIHRHHISTTESSVPKSTKDIPCKTSIIPDELLLWKCNENSVGNSNTNSQATIKWPAVTKPADSHKTINTVKSKPIVSRKSEISTSSTLVSKVQSKDTETRPQRKDNFSERKMGEKNKWSRKGDKVAITLEGTVLKEDNGSEYETSSPYGKEKDTEVKKYEVETKKDEVKNKSQKNFSSRRYYSDAQSIALKDDDSSIGSKESNGKNKTKVQESSKSKDNGNSTSKKQASVVSRVTSTETAKKGKITKSEENILSETSLLKGKLTKSEENISSETSSKVDEIKIENKNYRKGTKQKFSRITEDNSKSVSGNESQLGIEEKKEIDDAFKFSVDASALTNLSLDFSEKEELSSVDDVYVSLDFDSSITTTPLGVKKATTKTKSKEFKVSKDISLKAEDIPYCKNEDSDAKHVQHEICKSLLNERLSEHHFGDKSKNSLHGDSSPPEDSKLDEKFESQMLDFDSCSSNAKEADDSLFKSTIDKVIVQPHRSWSSIVSSSKSSIKETVTSSETLLPDLEEFKLSPEQSWSDVTSTEVVSSLVPLESRESSAVYKFNAVDFKKLEDIEDYSDDGEDKVTIGSNKSQSSDRTSGSDMVTASESLSIIVTSESSSAIAVNEEEINGNDDDVLENGDSAGVAAGTGGSKKSRRAKKKRR